MGFSEDGEHIVHAAMADDISKTIFSQRVCFSNTGDEKYIERMLDDTVRIDSQWVGLLRKINELGTCGNLVLFGFGIWGKMIYKETKEIVSWKCIIDSKPSDSIIEDTLIFSADEYLKEEQDDIFVISSYKNRSEMRKMLIMANISEERIIDASEVINNITEGKIYFDDDIAKFDEILSSGAFVDGGCFDGKDTLRFFDKTNGTGFAYCFEPDAKNLKKVKDNFYDLNGKVKVISKALWNEETDICFSENGSAGSKVSDIGCKVLAGTIDAEVGNTKVSMIKMDIEGAELKALKGASSVIKRDHPVLAISVYHKPEDILEIPLYIFKLYDGYKLYLRHYSFSWYDTVLYAVPERVN